jgi:hypothetical protein
MLCGWRTRCDLRLCGVEEIATNGADFDVLIEIAGGLSPIAKDEGPIVLQHWPERSLIRIPYAADFEVTMGRQIRVWPAAESTQKDIEIYLFGPAWASLCHQRRILPLHASAILTASGIAAFAGHSGSGKSSIAASMSSLHAASMSSLHYELIADDILAISNNKDELPGAWPYLRRLKLTADSLSQLSLRAIEPVSERLDKTKYFVLPKYSTVDKWSRLYRVYLLEIDPTEIGVTIDQLSGADAVRALVDQTYHFDFVLGTRQLGEHLASCVHLASKIAVYRVRRPPQQVGTLELGLLIHAHLENKSV